MVSRKDVAELAEVSPTSVSYYINDTGYVGAKARQRIQEAIDTLGYNPNQIARSLKIKDSRQFVFFCNEIRNPFYSQLVHQATKAALKEDYVTLFSPVVDDDKYIRKVCGYQISGVFASNNRIGVDAINTMAKQNIPVVILRDVKWPDLSPKVTQIKVDYSYIMDEIVVHLREQGCNEMHYISSSSSPKILDEKTKAFFKAYNKEDVQVSFGIADTSEAFEKIVSSYSSDNCPDAFVCTNDAVAFGVLKAITTIGLRVPEDVMVVGFDNAYIAKYSVPSITSVDIESEKMGKIAIDLLIRKLHGEEVDDYVVTPHLIVRQSSIRE
ncbi:MAG: LacI family DNA-binding transcriptional regulator [Sphaerochaeta sp.]|nr:LacI family DNA-binding transcriptional regulator [Sphaerochaeta sp.]